MKAVTEICICFVITVNVLLAHADTEQITDDKDEMCSKDREEFCKLPGILRKIPSTESKLEKFCYALNKNAHCMIQWTLNCNFESWPTIRMNLDFCVNDTALYEGFKNHMGCIHEEYSLHARNKTFCRSYMRDVEDEVRKFKESGKAKEIYPRISDKDYSRISDVLYKFNDLGCYLYHSKCPEAEDIILEAHARMHARVTFPLEKYRSTILAMAGLHLDIPMPQRKWIIQSIEKYEKKCEIINCKSYSRKKYAEQLLES